MPEMPPLKILMLEDVATDAELIEHELAKAGLVFTSQQVSTKPEFLAALDEFNPDVILSDYALPQFTGLEAFMLTQQRNLVIPFLLVTGALPEETIIEIIKAGIDDYILKGNLRRLPSSLQNSYAKKKAEKRNQELNELRKKFITIMSHQLRTPLTVVRWSLEHLLSGDTGHLKPAQEAVLREAYEANQQLIVRTDDLLTVIKIEEGRALIDPQPVDLEDALKPVIAKWKKAAASKGIRCEYTGVGKGLMVNADPEKIRLVFEKLIENAFAYTAEKGNVHLSLQQHAGRARFEITDSGVGIPEVEQQHIFTPFFRAGNASVMQPDASGVGLTIARYFVEQHQGAIGFTSQEDTGSTFWVELPLA